VCADCVVPPAAEAEVSVEISRPTWRAGPDFGAADPIEILEGVVMARTLFDAFVRVLNLTDEHIKYKKINFLERRRRSKFLGRFPSLFKMERVSK